MAEQTGKIGAIYYRKGYLAASSGIAFVEGANDTITDASNRFVDSGFAAGMVISVSGTDSNNTVVATIKAGGAAAGTLTLADGEVVTNENAGAAILTEVLPGTQVLGFKNWKIDHGVEILDATTFEDGIAGYKTKVATFTDWTATAEGYWLTDTQYNWVGSTVLFRFFVNYQAAPNTTNSYYYEGSGIVTGISTTAEPTTLITQSFNIQGAGALTLITRSTAWPT
jgi:hypothetical protein